jgi:hypothetical protein
MEEKNTEVKEPIQEESKPEKKEKIKKEILYPKVVYIGSDTVEGYSIIHLPEMDTEYRHDVAVKSITTNIINEALKKAMELSKNSKPVWEDGITTLSITLTNPKEGKPMNDQVSDAGLPPGALATRRLIKEGQRYRILVVSLTWTARWVCLPKEGIEFPENNEIEMSGKETQIGNKVFDFGVPKPVKHNTVRIIHQLKQSETRKTKLSSFLAEVQQYENSYKGQLEIKLYTELTEAINHLPVCPNGVTDGELSITIGYPTPYYFGTEEKSYTFMEYEYGYNDAVPPQYVKKEIPTERPLFEIKGEWSWSVQRDCEE